MAYLINRNPSGRLICLHALTSYLERRFSVAKFRLNDLKYDSTAPTNIHEACRLLVRVPAVNSLACPYLENPLSKAKCYLTQSIQQDTQKSKSASDAFNALEGLGWINRDDNQGYLTPEGLRFAKYDYFSPEAAKPIRQAVMRYGPFWALLFICSRHKNSENVVRREDIRIGYPETQEVILRDGRSVLLSTGSQADTVTRTRSVLSTWGVTAGFLLPTGLSHPEEDSRWHVELLPYIKAQTWPASGFRVFGDDTLTHSKPYVERPLGYSAMTKSTKALRERNQEAQRAATMAIETIVRNRRFAVSYLLALASEQGAGVHFDLLLAGLSSHKPLFVIDESGFAEVMRAELEMAFATGIPFYEHNKVLVPLTRLNINELARGAPEQVIETLTNIFKEVVSG